MIDFRVHEKNGRNLAMVKNWQGYYNTPCTPRNKITNVANFPNETN